MPEPDPARHNRRIAFLATQGLSEAGLAQAVQALEAAGIQIDVVDGAPQIVSENGTASRLAPHRVSVEDYCALALPASAQHNGAGVTSANAVHLLHTMEEAGKPILYVRLPADAVPAGPGRGKVPGFHLKKLLAASWRRWNAINAPRLGAALAYYTLLSLAPLLVLVVSIAGVFFRRALIQSGLIWQVRNLMGDVGAGIVRPLLQHSQSASGIIAGVLGILTLLLGASGVFLELRDSLDTVWEVRPNYGSGAVSLVKERLFAFLMVLGTGLLLSLSILLTALLETPVRFVLKFLPESSIVRECLAAAVSLAVITLVFALIYKVVPDIHIRWSDVWIGALVTALLFAAGKWLIGLYLVTAGIGSLYAAAGSLIVFLTWVYYSVQIFLFGAGFTHEYALRHGSYSAAIRTR